MTLEATDIHYSYGDETVFEELSMTVSPGEIVAIIGPSGVGKSSLLRLLALFDSPDAGTIEYDGTAVWEVSGQRRLELRRRLGMVFQTASLFDASVRRNAEYGRKIRQSWTDRLQYELSRLVGKQNGMIDVSDALETVGLADQAAQDAASLSGGESQRVAFARALAYDPDVLLLDEPTSDLDPRNTAVLEDAMLDARDRDIGVAIATHDMHQAERIADRVAVVLGNDIIELGPTEGVFEDPRDERTRKFINGELLY